MPADKMVVGTQIGVESSLTVKHIDPTQQTGPLQCCQRSVYGVERYVGKPPSHRVVHGVDIGVPVGSSNFFVDLDSLGGDAQPSVSACEAELFHASIQIRITLRFSHRTFRVPPAVSR
jgi:hypothetical protein